MTRPPVPWRDAFLALLALACGMVSWWLVQMNADVRTGHEAALLQPALRERIEELEHQADALRLDAQRHEDQVVALQEAMSRLVSR